MYAVFRLWDALALRAGEMKLKSSNGSVIGGGSDSSDIGRGCRSKEAWFLVDRPKRPYRRVIAKENLGFTRHMGIPFLFYVVDEHGKEHPV